MSIEPNETDQLRAQVAALREAAVAVISAKFSTYKSRNGRDCYIEDDSGEKCWIVPFDEMWLLEQSVTQSEASATAHDARIWNAAIDAAVTVIASCGGGHDWELQSLEKLKREIRL